MRKKGEIIILIVNIIGKKFSAHLLNKLILKENSLKRLNRAILIDLIALISNLVVYFFIKKWLKQKKLMIYFN